MKNKNFVVLVAVAFLMLLQLPGLCADSLRIGSGNFKASGPIVANVVGSGVSVNFAGRKGTRIGTALFLFDEIASQIQPGAEFEVIAGDGENGKVLVSFTDQTVSRSGTVKLIASDEETTATGTIKILSGDSSNFTFSINAQFNNVLQRVSNPLKGNVQGNDSRSKKTVRLSGKLTASPL